MMLRIVYYYYFFVVEFNTCICCYILIKIIYNNIICNIVHLCLTHIKCIIFFNLKFLISICLKGHIYSFHVKRYKSYHDIKYILSRNKFPSICKNGEILSKSYIFYKISLQIFFITALMENF